MTPCTRWLAICVCVGSGEGGQSPPLSCSQLLASQCGAESALDSTTCTARHRSVHASTPGRPDRKDVPETHRRSHPPDVVETRTVRPVLLKWLRGAGTPVRRAAKSNARQRVSHCASLRSSSSCQCVMNALVPAQTPVSLRS